MAYIQFPVLDVDAVQNYSIEDLELMKVMYRFRFCSRSILLRTHYRRASLLKKRSRNCISLIRFNKRWGKRSDLMGPIQSLRLVQSLIHKTSVPYTIVQPVLFHSGYTVQIVRTVGMLVDRAVDDHRFRNISGALTTSAGINPFMERAQSELTKVSKTPSSSKSHKEPYCCHCTRGSSSCCILPQDFGTERTIFDICHRV